MKTSHSHIKTYATRIVRMFVLTLTLLALALPAYADIPVKFFGELTPNALDAEFETVVNDFFNNDPRNRGDFACFQGDLLNLTTGNPIGTGIDCLSIAPINDTTNGDTTGGVPDVGVINNTVDVSLVIDAVTFFFLPGGYIINDGLTTVRPFFEGVGNGDGTDNEGSVTHITGSVPGESASIVSATGRFANLENSGNVRLSGAVNLGLPGTVFFSCIFVIQFG